jgi:hypothetical protein
LGDGSYTTTDVTAELPHHTLLDTYAKLSDDRYGLGTHHTGVGYATYAG